MTDDIPSIYSIADDVISLVDSHGVLDHLYPEYTPPEAGPAEEHGDDDDSDSGDEE